MTGWAPSFHDFTIISEVTRRSPNWDLEHYLLLEEQNQFQKNL